jgi:hypothetical protein
MGAVLLGGGGMEMGAGEGWIEVTVVVAAVDSASAAR